MKWLNLPDIPTQEIKVDSGHTIDILRLDKTDEHISGNKWFKLKHNILKTVEEEYEQLLTFGGAYSNHIYATAAACKAFGIKSIGIIRGEEHLPLNPTLQFAKDCGMQLHYISRSQYRDKYNEDFLNELENQFGPFYMVPEGGTNELAIKGASEIPELFIKSYDYIAISSGTAGTVSGIIKNNICKHSKLLCFPALKGAHFIEKEVINLLGYLPPNIEFELDYHFGGYAKTNTQLLEFISDMCEEYNLPLDPVYNAKAFYGLLDYLNKNNISIHKSVLYIHTGGLQGNNDQILS